MEHERIRLWRGLNVTWLHTPRGGYGYTFRIPATVAKDAGETGDPVAIRVTKASGEVVVRRVSRANIRVPDGQHVSYVEVSTEKRGE